MGPAALALELLAGGAAGVLLRAAVEVLSGAFGSSAVGSWWSFWLKQSALWLDYRKFHSIHIYVVAGSRHRGGAGSVAYFSGDGRLCAGKCPLPKEESTSRSVE